MKNKMILSLVISALLLTTISGCGNDGNKETTNDILTEINTDATETTPVEETQKQIPDIDELSYPQFNALSPEEQQAVIDSFDTVEEFFEWHEEVKELHEELTNKLNSPQNSESNTEPTEGEGTTDAIDPSEENPEVEGVTFLDYQAMSGMEQKKFINSFPSIDAFMQWHTLALQEYKDSMVEFDATNPVIIPTASTEIGN